MSEVIGNTPAPISTMEKQSRFLSTRTRKVLGGIAITLAVVGAGEVRDSQPVAAQDNPPVIDIECREGERAYWTGDSDGDRFPDANELACNEYAPACGYGVIARWLHDYNHDGSPGPNLNEFHCSGIRGCWGFAFMPQQIGVKMYDSGTITSDQLASLESSPDYTIRRCEGDSWPPRLPAYADLLNDNPWLPEAFGNSPWLADRVQEHLNQHPNDTNAPWIALYRSISPIQTEPEVDDSDLEAEEDEQQPQPEDTTPIQTEPEVDDSDLETEEDEQQPQPEDTTPIQTEPEVDDSDLETEEDEQQPQPEDTTPIQTEPEVDDSDLEAEEDEQQPQPEDTTPIQTEPEVDDSDLEAEEDEQQPQPEDTTPIQTEPEVDDSDLEAEEDEQQPQPEDTTPIQTEPEVDDSDLEAEEDEQQPQPEDTTPIQTEPEVDDSDLEAEEDGSDTRTIIFFSGAIALLLVGTGGVVRRFKKREPGVNSPDFLP